MITARKRPSAERRNRQSLADLRDPIVVGHALHSGYSP